MSQDKTTAPQSHVVPAQNSDNLQLETRSNPSSGDPEYGGADPRALKHDTSQAFPPQVRKSYSFIGDDCPPGYRCVGTIDVADPADVHSAQDKGYRIGAIYDGQSGSCAEPCAADIYERPDEVPPPPHQTTRQVVSLNEEALDKAAREEWAVSRHTHGPRVLAEYASKDIMDAQLLRASRIVTEYLKNLPPSPQAEEE